MKHEWSFVSFELFIRSKGRFFRAREKCREQWFNHLDPTLKKGDWTLEEDIELIEAVIHHGKKWSKISKILNINRNEHMIKNRYNSIVSKMRRKMKKIKNMEEGILIELRKML